MILKRPKKHLLVLKQKHKNPGKHRKMYPLKKIQFKKKITLAPKKHKPPNTPPKQRKETDAASSAKKYCRELVATKASAVWLAKKAKKKRSSSTDLRPKRVEKGGCFSVSRDLMFWKAPSIMIIKNEKEVKDLEN